MRKVKFKNVKELYGGGGTEVLNAEISSVVKGSSCSEGFSDEADCVATLNMGSLKDEKGYCGAQLSSQEPGLKEVPGTCNTCASSFSPCVHSNQMATKTNEFLGKACQKKDSNCCSFNSADLSSPRVNSACNDRRHTSSETSHPLSVCLSRESFSEVAESKETSRDYNTHDSLCGDVNDNHPMRTNRSSIEFSQEIFYCSNKSDFSEISSLRDSCAGASSAKREHSECSEDQVQSSFARTGALQVGSQIGDEHNTAESMEVDNGINERVQIAEIKSITTAKEINMEETNIGSRPATCSDAPDSIEYEVNVCDICGDIGREELLVVCSNCNDGAEHIYCMRVKMDSVPKGDWMCEECVLSKETERKKQDKLDGGVRTFKKPSTLESETKPLEVEESQAHKVTSIPLFTSKRPSSSLQAVRNKAFGTDLKSPATSSSSSKASMHQSGGHSSSTTSKTVRIPTELSSKSRKLSSQYQVSKGLLSKSKSFSVTSLKEDFQLLKEGCFRNEGLAKEIAASESEGRVQMMSRSMSLKNMSSHTVSNSNYDIKLLPSSSRVEDLKRSRHPKGQCSTKTEKKLKLSNSDSPAAMTDKRITSPGKNSLAYPSSSSCRDLVDVKGHEISDNSLKISGNSARKSFQAEEKKSVLNVRHHVDNSTEVVPAFNKKHSKATADSDERPCLRESSMFASKVHMPSWISVVPQFDSIWEGKFEIQCSGGLPFTCDGLQAHLSTYASHKVLEVVQKLPRKLLLEEAPRLSMWPTQFMKSHATEDNIGLYFFAKELDSYERSYKTLLDRMIKYDFSLKGNFGEFELLIFSSNLLPEKSQRWNFLLFLWGVFKGRRVHCSEQISTLSASENLFPHGKSSESLSRKMVEACEAKALSWEQKLKTPLVQTSCSQQVGTVHSSEREERESKGRPEIDLNSSLQEGHEYFADSTEADGNNESKSLKSCFSGMNIDSNRTKDINDRCSVPINSRGPSIFGEFKRNGAYDMSIVNPESDSVSNKYSWKHLLLSNDGANQLNSSVSNFELALGVDRRDEICGREASDDTTPSLALSLALPYHKAGGSGPKCDEMNTTLSLFGLSSEY